MNIKQVIYDWFFNDHPVLYHLTKDQLHSLLTYQEQMLASWSLKAYAILQEIVDDPDIYLVWTGKASEEHFQLVKIQVAREQALEAYKQNQCQTIIAYYPDADVIFAWMYEHRKSLHVV